MRVARPRNRMSARTGCALAALALLPVAAAAQDRAPAKPVPAVASRAEAPAAGQRLDLNLLGQTDTSSGESRRNENVQFNLIDRNAMRELNARLGTTATPVPVYEAERSYFGTEYGRPPTTSLHLPRLHESGVHGALWEAHGNHLLRARSFFQAGPVRPATENDYGFRFTSKLAGQSRFSVDGSQQKLRGFVNGNILVPRADERTPLAADPAVRRIVERWLAAYPLEAPNRTDIDPRALNTNAPQRINTNALGSRIDVPLGIRNRLGLRYQFTSQQVDAFQLVAGQNPDTDTHSHNGTITWSREVSATTVAIFSAGFERVTTLIRPEPNAVGPTVSAANVIQGLGPPPPIPITRAQNRFRSAAAIGESRGDHRWSAGAEVVRSQINGREQDGERGILTFGNDFGRDALANFRTGTPTTYTQSLGNTHRGYRAWNMLLFAGDTWRASSNLTLQGGIRYEPMTRPVEVNHLDVIPFPCDCNNVAPRLALAYRLPKEWGVIRSAYGLHYGEIFATTYSQVRMSPPGSYRVIVGAPDLRDPLGGLTLAGIGKGFRTGVFDVSPHMTTPYSHQYNFTWERGLGQFLRLQTAYVGSRTHKLFQMWFDNRARVVTGIPQTSATINQRRPDPNYLEVLRLLNGSRSWFDAGRITLTATRTRGLSGELSYWFSKSMDLGNDYTSTLSGGDARQGRSQSEGNVHGDLKGRSQFDQPHALLGRGSWETPAARTVPSWLRAVAGQWVLSGVALLKNGTPFSVESGSDAPGFGNVDGQGGDRVNVMDPRVLGRTIGNPDTSVSLLSRSAFTFIAPTDERGNLEGATHSAAARSPTSISLWRGPGDSAVSGRWSSAPSQSTFSTRRSSPSQTSTSPRRVSA